MHCAYVYCHVALGLHAFFKPVGALAGPEEAISMWSGQV
jgi:hypothetical protein